MNAISSDWIHFYHEDLVGNAGDVPYRQRSTWFPSGDYEKVPYPPVGGAAPEACPRLAYGLTWGGGWGAGAG